MLRQTDPKWMEGCGERERGEEMQKQRETKEREKSLRGNIRTF